MAISHNSSSDNDKANDTKVEDSSYKDGTTSPEQHQQLGPAEYINGKPYWRTSLFLGSFWAIGLGVLACYAGFAMPANTLALIDADLGQPCTL